MKCKKCALKKLAGPTSKTNDTNDGDEKETTIPPDVEAKLRIAVDKLQEEYGSVSPEEVFEVLQDDVDGVDGDWIKANKKSLTQAMVLRGYIDDCD
jgi:hypothetical protein